jgi:hypothetical protein
MEVYIWRSIYGGAYVADAGGLFCQECLLHLRLQLGVALESRLGALDAGDLGAAVGVGSRDLQQRGVAAGEMAEKAVRRPCKEGAGRRGSRGAPGN